MNCENYKNFVFDDVLTIVNGKNQRAVEDKNGKYPIYGSGGIMGYANDYLCPENTVIVGRKGSINKPIFVQQKFWNVDTAFGLVAKNDLLESKYLYYFCEHFDFERLNKAVTIPSLTKSDLLKIQIPLPPLSTQKHIAAVLDKCTEVIAKHKLMLEKYDTLIKSRFIEMFGDEPIENGKWKVERLENVCTKITDGEHGSVSRTSNGFVFLNAKHIKQSGEIDWGTATYISEENHKKIYKRCNPQHNDILLTTTGTIGNVAIVPDVKEFSMDRGITLLKPQFSILNPQFIASYLRMDKMQVIMNQNVHASAIGHLFLNKVYSLQIPVPPLSLQNDFASFVQQIDKSKFAVQKSLEKAETLYKSLMQEYFG